jgi:NosR/NirI family nitrous oxide reductase transcriptional regulator
VETGALILARARERAAYPDGVRLRRALDMYYAEARDPAGRLLELHLENTGLNRNVKGYAGPIDLHLVVGMDGRIRTLSHVKSAETTSYLNRIRNAGFYERFAGLPLDGNSYRVDLVSGASLTTEGIARSVTQLVGLARESPLESYMETHAQGFEVRAVQPRTWIVESLLIVALFAVVWLRRLRRTGPLMLIVGVASLLFLGFYMNNSFTYVTFTQPFLGVRWSWLLGIYAGLVLVSAIWDGNSYCRYVCPYGNAQRLLLRWIPWRGRLAIPNRLLGALRWLITLSLLAGILAGLRDWGSFELFPDLFGLEFTGSPWFWLSLGLVLVSAYYPMLWCRALCPTGAVLDGLTYLARPRSLTVQD